MGRVATRRFRVKERISGFGVETNFILPSSSVDVVSKNMFLDLDMSNVNSIGIIL
jgi:hypothetical protein